MNKHPKHLYWLDSMRFIAALMVAVAHIRAAVFVDFGSLDSSSKTIFAAIAFAVTRISNEAVVLFFVLSGFLVGGRALHKMMQGEFDCHSYAIDRISRIFVPLIPALLLTAIVLYVTQGTLDVSVLAANIFSLQGITVEPYGGNEPLWSLSYEIWFYVLAFAVGWAVTQKQLSLGPLLAIFVVFVVFIYLDAAYLLCWILGAAVFFMPKVKYIRSTLILSGLTIGISIIGIQLTSGSNISALDSVERFLLPIEVFRLSLSVAMGLFVRQVIELKPRHKLAVQFESFSSKMAKSSYTLYLTHFPLIHLLQYFGLKPSNSLNLHALMMFLFVVLLSLLNAYLFYWLFERHTQSVRQWLRSRVPKENKNKLVNALN